MPESPKLSYAEVSDARDKFTDAWDKKWYKPHTWFRQSVGTGIGRADNGGCRVAIILKNDRQRKTVLKVANRSIPNVPLDVRVVGVIRAA